MDYDLALHKSTTVMSLAGVFPLVFRIANDKQADHVHEHQQKFFKRRGRSFYSQQERTTMGFSEWSPPLQYLTYEGLRNYNFYATAREFKKRWIALNDKVFRETGKMMEKYNVVDIDLPAGGGEYPKPGWLWVD